MAVCAYNFVQLKRKIKWNLLFIHGLREKMHASCCMQETLVHRHQQDCHKRGNVETHFLLAKKMCQNHSKIIQFNVESRVLNGAIKIYELMRDFQKTLARSSSWCSKEIAANLSSCCKIEILFACYEIL